MKYIYFFLLIVSVSFAQPKLPALSNYANDYTNTLTSQQLSNLDYRLRTFDDTTSNQLVVLIIPTLNNYPLEEFANETAIKNKIGTKKNDNGVLLLVVKNDRKIRIEVGYGLEGALPDALASSIIRNVIIPHFRNDDYYAGITDGINAIILATKGEYKVNTRASSRKNSPSHIFTILMILFFIISFFIRSGRRGSGGFIFWGGGFGSGGGFSSGGSFGGGGFSGGGGSFGGGGASGSW